MELMKEFAMVCRLMERENKKSREDARKEFNETVRVSVNDIVIKTKS